MNRGARGARRALRASSGGTEPGSATTTGGLVAGPAWLQNRSDLQRSPTAPSRQGREGTNQERQRPLGRLRIYAIELAAAVIAPIRPR